MPPVQAALKAGPMVRLREVNHGGGSPRHSRPGAGLKIIGSHDAAAGHVEMGVGVDSSRCNQTAGHIHHLFPFKGIQAGACL